MSGNKTFLADLIRRYLPPMPTREEMAGNKYLAPIAHRFLSPELWRFTRRSVPRGVALGLFCGFIIPIGQIFLAAFLALPARANVPLAALVTFVTNPFTLPFWLVVAKGTGELVLNTKVAMGIDTVQHLAEDGGWLALGFELAGVTAFGFVVLAIVTAAAGYVVSGLMWRFIIHRRRARRLRQMERRLDRRLETEQQ
ncbi:DUF2062 domain-containing protein [Parerythrobacter aurantius]|uniref:DUF2062 domain-containing protein n=1 Tax=Parerythrobacter aurantius TaxID=3127706 RepID=UPI003252F88C